MTYVMKIYFLVEIIVCFKEIVQIIRASLKLTIVAWSDTKKITLRM